MKANDLKPGKAIVQDGQVWIVTKTEHVKPGKGGAFVQAKVKNMKTGSVQEKRFRSSDDVDGINLDRREMEYLYSDGSGAIFMDTESFDQVTLPEDVLDDSPKYCKPNEKISGLHHDGQCLSIELPQTVELEVTDAPPGVKNCRVGPSEENVSEVLAFVCGFGNGPVGPPENATDAGVAATDTASTLTLWPRDAPPVPMLSRPRLVYTER